MVGGIDHQHVTSKRGPGQALRDNFTTRSQRSAQVFGQARIAQRSSHLGITQNQPRVMPVGQGDRLHGSAFANLGKQAERIITVKRTPRRQRLLDSAHLTTTPGWTTVATTMPTTLRRPPRSRTPWCRRYGQGTTRCSGTLL